MSVLAAGVPTDTGATSLNASPPIWLHGLWWGGVGHPESHTDWLIVWGNSLGLSVVTGWRGGTFTCLYLGQSVIERTKQVSQCKETA